MATHKNMQLDYKTYELHPLHDEQHHLLFDDDDVQKGLDVTAAELSDVFTKHRKHFEADKHFVLTTINDVEKEYWTKQGIVKLAFFMEQTPEVMEFVDFLEEEPTLKVVEQPDYSQLQGLYKSVEEKFVQFAENAAERGSISDEKLQRLINTFNELVTLQQRLSPPPATKKAHHQSESASGSRGEHIFLETSKRASDFITGMAENAYEFATQGMEFGYLFASQGEENGPMANRILWMASEIGVMADRIGEMGDRIVHTEHLIMNMSANIVHFGLIIDSTIKTLTDAGLKTLGAVLERDVKPLEYDNRYLDIIHSNIQLMMQQQHEYDLKVLENQKELRQISREGLDRLQVEY